MNPSLIAALEFTLVVGLVLGLAVWELLRLRRDMAQKKDEGAAPRPDEPAA